MPRTKKINKVAKPEPHNSNNKSKEPCNSDKLPPVPIHIKSIVELTNECISMVTDNNGKTKDILSSGQVYKLAMTHAIAAIEIWSNKKCDLANEHAMLAMHFYSTLVLNECPLDSNDLKYMNSAENIINQYKLWKK